MQELRRSLANLRSPLPDATVGAALPRLADETAARTELAVACAVSPAPVPPAAGAALWRVAREALTNSERHAYATQLAVRLDVSAGWATLQIVDNGVGL